MDCNTCMHYLVCKHTDEVPILKDMASKINPATPEVFSVDVTCKHELHSDDVIAAR